MKTLIKTALMKGLLMAVPVTLVTGGLVYHNWAQQKEPFKIIAGSMQRIDDLLHKDESAKKCSEQEMRIVESYTNGGIYAEKGDLHIRFKTDKATYSVPRDYLVKIIKNCSE